VASDLENLEKKTSMKTNLEKPLKTWKNLELF